MKKLKRRDTILKFKKRSITNTNRRMKMPNFKTITKIAAAKEMTNFLATKRWATFT